MNKAVYFDPIGCLMLLCTGRSKAHLTVATDCTVFIIARSNSKDADILKRRVTELHLRAG